MYSLLWIKTSIFIALKSNQWLFWPGMCLLGNNCWILNSFSASVSSKESEERNFSSEELLNEDVTFKISSRFSSQLCCPFYYERFELFGWLKARQTMLLCSKPLYIKKEKWKKFLRGKATTVAFFANNVLFTFENMYRNVELWIVESTYFEINLST